MPPAFFFVVLIVVVIVAIAGSRYMKKVAAAWAEAGAALGLDYNQKGFRHPRLTGSIGGMRTEVDIRVQRSGKNQQTFTRYRVWMPSPGFEFRMTRQTGISRITKFFGAQDVELGDTAFDDAFVVKSNDEARLRDLVDVGMMGLLVRTAVAYPGIVFENDLVSFERNRTESSRDKLVSTTTRLAQAAAALAKGTVPAAARDIVAARERGELAEMAAKMRNAAERKAETLDERLLELDTLATAGEREAARERLRDLEASVPADPEVMGWKERLSQPKPSARPARGPVDPEDLAADVFAGSALSFESKSVFDEKYRGSQVQWTGRVKSIGRISSGSEIGEPGADKLVATIATIDHDLYGNTDIDAVVGLAARAGVGLRRGDEVTFSGGLVRVDALVRNVFVADGRLL